jgi:hypothetical protein
MLSSTESLSNRLVRLPLWVGLLSNEVICKVDLWRQQCPLLDTIQPTHS